MSNVRRRQDGELGQSPRKNILDPHPYGKPFSRTETHRVTERIHLPDGRVAVRTDETVTEANGIERDPPIQIKYPDPEPGAARGCLTGLVVFFGMCFAYDSLSSVSDHPLEIFAYWLVGFVIWSVIR